MDSKKEIRKEMEGIETKIGIVFMTNMWMAPTRDSCMTMIAP